MDDRWDRLFADLEALATPALDEDEIPDMVEAERVAVALADRLAGAVGRHRQGGSGRPLVSRALLLLEFSYAS